LSSENKSKNKNQSHEPWERELECWEPRTREQEPEPEQRGWENQSDKCGADYNTHFVLSFFQSLSLSLSLIIF
jgi:hypothetical protein